MDPNVLVIVVDALRADRVGAVGGRDLTPNIDDLAKDGTVFTQAFSTTHATDPAVTSIMTGQYPLSHGITNHGKRVTDAEKKTVENTTQLPEMLLEAGYRTAKFGRPLGRWHRKGFEIYPETGEWRDAFDTDSGSSSTKKRIGQTLERIDPRLKQAATTVYQKISSGFDSSSATFDRTDDRTDILSQFQSFIDNDDSSPFFSYVHLMDTHAQYDASLEKVEYCLENFQYENISIDNILNKSQEGSHIYNHLSDGYPIRNTADYWKNTAYGFGTAVVNAHYDATVLEADERIGKILDSLRERDILDNTLVILLSDHGESLTEQGIYYSHHGLYESTVHVPLVISPPGGSNSTCNELVQITDIAPTIASYTGIQGFSNVDGSSLKSTIEYNKEVGRDFVMAEDLYYQRRRMVRTEKEKVIYTIRDNNICRYCDIEHASRKEFYDLLNDPGETTNLAESNFERFKKLQDLAEDCAETMSTKATQDTDDETQIEYEDEDAIHERLEALGYK